MRTIFMSLCLWILWMPIPDVANSQEEEDYTGAYTLGEVVVRAEKEGVEAIGTVREITKVDIESKGARTLDEAIELLPGLNIRTGGDGVPRVDLRGFRSRHVILLLDSIPFNTTFDANFDPTLLPVENIEKIKVSYGTHSVLYGDGGLGGVINIVTKRGKKGVHVATLGEGGQDSHYLGQFGLSGAHEKVDFFLSGSIFETDGFRLSDDFRPTTEEDGGLRENSDKRRNNFFANVNFAPHDRLTIGSVFSYSKGKFGKPPSTINDPDDIFADRPKFERVDDSEGVSGHLSMDYDVPGPLGLRAWLFINQLREEENRYDNNNYNSMDDPTVKGTFHQVSTTRIKGASVHTSFDMKTAGFLTLALNARREEWDADGKIRDVQIGGGSGGGGGGGSGGGGTFAFRDFRDEREIDIYSVALEYEVSPLKNLGLVFGYAHNWMEKEDIRNDDAGSFLAGAYYDIFENTRIRGSVARKIRFPSIRQLYEEESGNPDLTSEKSYNYELGLEQKLPGNSSVALTGFLIDAKDYIEKIPPTDMSLNNDRYRFQGFELMAGTRFIKNMMLRTGYTYLYTKDRSPETERDELQYKPKHKVIFEGKYYFDFGLSPYMNIIYVADQIYYSKDFTEKRKLNDYTLVNFKLDQALLKNRLHLYLGVDNLFDEDYEQSYGLPQAGRFIYGGLTFSI